MSAPTITPLQAPATGAVPLTGRPYDNVGGLAPTTGRFDSIDLVRGLVMVIMLLDHTRDFTHASGLLYDPLDLERTTGWLFLTRWITHLCAPAFVFLAGTSSGIQRIRGTPVSELRHFLWTRGLWLVALELVLFRVLIWWDASPSLVVFMQVIWVTGWSMLLLAGALALPMRAIGAIGLVIVAGHNLLDTVRVTPWRGPGTAVPDALGKLWIVLHQTGVFPLGTNLPDTPPTGMVLAMYPLLPWIGVMFAGYGFAELYTMEAARRKRALLGIAAALLVTFVALRWSNAYGDPNPWSSQATPFLTFLSFMNVQKYGPSLLFLCATLAPSMALLAAFDGKRIAGGLAGFFVTFGRVPLFFYVLQWIWAKLAGVTVALVNGQPLGYFTSNPFNAPQLTEFGGPLWVTWLCWLTGAVVLWFPCRWYAGVKARRRDLVVLRYL